jgi:hypothetical protein
MKLRGPVTETHTRVISLTCDLCGHKVEGDEWGPSGRFAEETTEISHERSWNRYGEGEWETISADICPECFRGKVVPALEAIGVKFQREEANT